MSRKSSVVLSSQEKEIIVGLLQTDEGAAEEMMADLKLTERQKDELRKQAIAAGDNG